MRRSVRERIVVLGAGFGGIVASFELARSGRDGEIVLIDRNAHHTYFPWLYETATGFLESKRRADVHALRNASVLTVHDLLTANGLEEKIRFREAEVSGVDTETRHVFLKGGKSLAYDKLVIALGAEAAFFGIKGVKEYGIVMKSVSDALSVREKLYALIRSIESGERSHAVVVIAGAGATGTETAAEIANFLRRPHVGGGIDRDAIRIVLVEAEDAVLPRFSKFMQRHAEKRLVRLGVEVWKNTLLQRVSKKRMILTQRASKKSRKKESTAALAHKVELPYDLLVWTGGIQPNSLVRSLRLPKDQRGRILVDTAMRVKGFEEVYAIGDIIAIDVKHGERPVSASAYMAVKEARVAARNIAAQRDVVHLHVPRFLPAIIVVGGKWAVAHIYAIPLVGRVAFYARLVADFLYFWRIMPLRYALAFHFRASIVHGKND